MNSRAIVTLALLFIFFVPSKGASEDSETLGGEATTSTRRRLGAPAAAAVVTNNVNLGETPTLMTFTLTVGASGALANGGSITITSTTAVFKDAASALSLTYAPVGSGIVDCVLTGAEDGSTTSTKLVVSLTNKGSGTCAIANNAQVIFHLDTSIAANDGALLANKDTVEGTADNDGTIKFAMKTSVDTTDTSSAVAHALGRISPYYVKSTCGFAATGAAQTCTGNPCKTCTTHGGFTLSTGTQSGDPGHTNCDGSGTTIRCDAMYFTDTAMDIYFTTRGNYGTAVCGAYKLGATAPTHSILGDDIEDGIENLISKNSVVVNKADRYLDAVITLTHLQPDTQYDVYCHMDEMIMSEKVSFWTAASTMMYDVSLTPSTTKTGLTPQMYLTFTHSADISTGNTVVLTAETSADGSLFTAQSNTATGACTATSTNHVGIQVDLTVSSSVVSNSGQGVLTITFGGSGVISTRGSRIDIKCLTTNKAANPAAGQYITYQLEVSGHDKIQKQRAWTVTST